MSTVRTSQSLEGRMFTGWTSTWHVDRPHSRSGASRPISAISRSRIWRGSPVRLYRHCNGLRNIFHPYGMLLSTHVPVEMPCIFFYSPCRSVAPDTTPTSNKALVDDHSIHVFLLAVLARDQPPSSGDQADTVEPELVPDGQGSLVGCLISSSRRGREDEGAGQQT